MLGRSAKLMLAPLVVSLTACQAGGGALSDADREGIRTASAAWEEHAGMNHWGIVAALYTDDATFLPPNTTAVTGRAAVEEALGSFPPVTLIDLRIRDLDGHGDVAYARGTYEMTMDVAGTPVDDRGKYIEIWRRQDDGTWQIAADIFNSGLPAQ